MMLLLLTITILTTPSRSLIINHLDQVDTRISLGNCIVEASKRFFTDFQTVTFSLPTAEVESDVSSVFVISHYVLGALQSQNQWAFLIKNMKLPFNTINNNPIISNIYIIQIRRRSEFATNLEKLKMLLSWNPHAKFLIASASVFDNPDDVAAEITEVLWKQHILDAAILLADPDNTTIFKVYSWDPYINQSCGNEHHNTYIDICSYGNIEYNTLWFNNKISIPLNNCTINASYLIWPPFVTNHPVFRQSDFEAAQGLEVNLLNMIAEYLNLFVKYTKSNDTTWPQIYDNGTATGNLKLLQLEELDIVLGGYIKTYATSLYFDSSRSYTQETLIWCVPHEPILLGLKPMIHILSKEVWIGLGLIYTIVTLMAWYLSKVSKLELRSYKKLRNVFLNNFLIIIGFSVSILPKSTGVRYFLGLLILFSLQLNILYSSYVTSTLSSHSFKEKYNELESIYENKLNTYFVPESKQFFSHHSHKDNYFQGVALRKILQNWKDCNNITRCVEDVLDGKPNAICLPEMYKEYLFSHVGSFYKRKYQITCLNDIFISFPINLIMRKGFPLYNLFQKIMDRISNSGFLEKWLKDILYQKHENIYLNKEMLMEYVSIKFVNLKVIFECLLLGHILSVLVFIGECIVHRKHS